MNLETSRLTLVDMVLPDQSNHHGTLFGGAALAMLDKLAFILGSKILRGSIVTAAVSQIDFRAPVPLGSLTEATGIVVRRGRRSVTIDAELMAEDILSGHRISCVRGQFVMVATEAVAAPPAVCPPDIDTVASCVAEIVFPGHTNHRGILHGGPAMAWLAKASFAAASRHARLPLVMASSERLDFLAPARVGDVVEITARVTDVRRRSLTVEAEMAAESPPSGERRQCTKVSFVFVAIGEDGRPIGLDSASAMSLARGSGEGDA
ncbi:MAG: acyl-CoA thioesterase [Azonexus sp.]